MTHTITLDALRGMDDAAFNRAIAEMAGWTHIPDYATDLNAAWALCMSASLRWVIEAECQNDDNPAICIAGYGTTYSKKPEVREAHLVPARALSTAWAAWKLAQESER